MTDEQFSRLCDALHRAALGGLTVAIDAHGPISRRNLGSAGKRIKPALTQALRQELSRQREPEWLAELRGEVGDDTVEAFLDLGRETAKRIGEPPPGTLTVLYSECEDDH